MKALELADRIEFPKLIAEPSLISAINQAATMLRQLQAENNALKKSLTEAQQESLNWEDRYRSIT